MLQDQLFKIQEGPFVRHLLAHLDEGLPGVFGCKAGTIGALAVLDKVFYLERLFEDGVYKDLLVP